MPVSPAGYDQRGCFGRRMGGTQAAYPLGVDTAALVISIISLVIAMGSLLWQFVQWKLSAGRPEVALVQGLTEGTTSALTFPIPDDGEPFNFDEMRDQLLAQGVHTDTAIGIEIFNRGRSNVIVKEVVVHFEGAAPVFSPGGQTIGHPLPYRLEPGDQQTWLVKMTLIESMVDAMRATGTAPSGIYMTARFGTGKTPRTPQTLQM